MLTALRTQASRLRCFSDWPDRSSLQSVLDASAITNSSGMRLTLVPPSAEPYEARLYSSGELQFREREWHDLMNVLAWLAYPRAKAELNRRHYVAAQTEGTQRGRVRDALTLFDESGAIVVASDPSLLDDLRAFEWKRLFWIRRHETRERMRVYPFGHALMQKALAPYVGLTAHALLLLREPEEEVGDTIDAIVAAQLRDPQSFTTPQMLAPLPVLGVPGWWPANEREAFYDDAAYFRRERKFSLRRARSSGGLRS